MKTILILAFFLMARLSAAPVVEWFLVKTSVAGHSNDILIVESSIVIRADKEEIHVVAWRGDTDGMRVDIDVSASDDTKLVKVLGAGPAEAFRKTVIIGPGESRRFVGFTGVFFISRSGSYVATGKLVGVSVSGHAVDISLPEIQFNVEVGEQKKSN